MKNLTKNMGIVGIGLLSLLEVWKTWELISSINRKPEPEYFLYVTRMPEKYGGEIAIRLENREETVYDTSGGLYGYDPKVKIIPENAEQFIQSGMRSK